MIKFTNPTFVVIHNAERERIQRLPAVGEVKRETFAYREGQVGLLIPRFIRRWKKFRSTRTDMTVFFPITYDPCLGIDGQYESGDIEVVVCRTWPECKYGERGDYRLINLNQDEMIVIQSLTPSGIGREIQQTFDEIQSPAATVSEILDLCCRLEIADQLFQNPLSITREIPARKVSDGSLEAAKSQCYAAFCADQFSARCLSSTSDSNLHPVLT